MRNLIKECFVLFILIIIIMMNILNISCQNLTNTTAIAIPIITTAATTTATTVSTLFPYMTTISSTKKTTTGITNIRQTDQIILVANCQIGCSNLTTYNFTYQIYKLENQLSLTNVTWIAINLTESYISGYTTSTLTISSVLFTKYPNITYLRILLTVSGSNNTASETILKLNQIPLNGTCLVSATNGTAFDTNFTMTCSNWYDTDGSITSYEFYATYKGNMNPILLGKNVTSKFQLPNGPIDDSYQISLFAYIIDDSNGVTKFSYPTPIIVKPNVALIDSLATKLLSTDYLNELKSASVQYTTTLVTSLTSALDNQVAEANKTSAQTKKNTDIKTVLIDVITSLPAISVDNILLISNSLSILTNNSNEISLSSAASVSAKNSALTKTLLAYSDNLTLSVITQASSSIVGSMANSMLGLIVVNSKTNQSTRATRILVQDQLLVTHKQLNSILSQAATMTVSKLSTSQDLQIKTSSMELNYKKNGTNNFPNQIVFTDSQILVPNLCTSNNLCSNSLITSQAFFMSSSYPGANANDIVLKGAQTLALTLYNDAKSEINITNSSSPFQFTIPLDQVIPSFAAINLKQISNNLLRLDAFNLTKKNVSIQYHIKPQNKSIAYFVSLRFGAYPVLNNTANLYDTGEIFCPGDLRTEKNESFFVLFSSNSINYQGIVGIGLKELNTNEFAYFCTQKNSNLTNLDNQNQSSSAYNVSVRVLLAGCYYVDKITGIYSSYGVKVLKSTNTTHIQCESNHLTSFAGGWITVPNEIDFNYVFANSSFQKNITIYTTVIVISTAYILLLFLMIYKDRRDDLKFMSIVLPECKEEDEFFYEVNLRTESSKITNLEFKFELIGKNDSSRTFSVFYNKKKSNSFILSSSTLLGNIIFIKLDSKSQSSLESLLSTLTIHDLQSRKKVSFFYSNIDSKKKSYIYSLLYEARKTINDEHLWLSVIKRPSFSLFTRVDRLTCSFVILYMAMLLDIIYYEISSDTSILDGITPQIISVGIITNLITFPPGYILVLLFRTTRRRVTKLSVLDAAVRKIKGDLYSNNITRASSRKNKIIFKRKSKFSFKISFPWWFKIICYLLSFVFAVISVFFIITKGISLRDAECRSWLLAILTSMVTSGFISDPVVITLFVLFEFIVLKSSSKDSDDYDPDDDQGDPVYQHKNNETIVYTFEEISSEFVDYELKEKERWKY